MVPLTVPTQMLGAEVLRWLTGACLVKQMPEALVSATPVWLTERLDGLSGCDFFRKYTDTQTALESAGTFFFRQCLMILS